MRFIVSINRIRYLSKSEIADSDHRLLRMTSQGELLQTKNVGIIDSSSITWNDQFEIELENKWKQRVIEFEIFKQHTFGFSRQQLLGVLKGEINLKMAEKREESIQSCVFNLKKQVVGKLVLSIEIRNGQKTYLRSRSLKTYRIMTENPQIKLKLIKNMSIVTVFSIITNLKQERQLKNCYAILKVGPRIKSTSTIKRRQNIPIWIQTLTFKRQNQSDLELSIMMLNDNEEEVLIGQGRINLDEVEIKKHIISNKMNLYGNNNNLIGSCFIDIKAKVIGQTPLRQNTQKSITQMGSIQDNSICRKSLSNRNLTSHFSILQQLHSSRAVSPKITKQISVLYSNKNISMSKSQRFITNRTGKSPVSGYINVFGKNISDFNLTKRKHGNIGLGKKTDFSKYKKYLPGVGEYKLPSLFDRYK